MAEPADMDEMTASGSRSSRLRSWIGATPAWIVTAVVTAVGIVLSEAFCLLAYAIFGLGLTLDTPGGVLMVALPVAAPLLFAPLTCLPVARTVRHNALLLREIEEIRSHLEGEVAARRSLQSALEDQAARDPLTGLLNRRGFFQAVSGPRVSAATVLTLDVDGLKQMNDGWGHASGDVLLSAVADALRGSLDPGAHIARLGGDEFVALVEGTHDGLVLRVREALGRARLDLPAGAPGAISASIGWAHVRPGESVDLALATADRRMYEQKRTSIAARG